MKHFIIYNLEGKILRTGNCQDEMLTSQAGENEFVAEGPKDSLISDITQKIVNIRGEDVIVDKTLEEIERDNPSMPFIPVTQRHADITNEQWQIILDRLDKLEIRPTKIDS